MCHDIKQRQKNGAKGTLYDSVFTDLFSYSEYQLRLYKDLHPEDVEVTVDDIKTVTLKPVLTDQLYNDLGFAVRDKTILLVEAQSSWCENMSLRALLYLAETFRDYIIETEQNYYSSATVHLPKPELYVIYTGNDTREKTALSLADTFWGGDNSSVEVKVKVIYGNEPDTILSEYVAFTKTFKMKKALYGKTREAVKETIDECIEKNILKEYLNERRKEVMDIMTALFDDDVIQEMYEKSIRRESREQGLEEGLEQGKSDILSMNKYLIEQERYEDLKRATKDEAFRKTILKEMNET